MMGFKNFSVGVKPGFYRKWHGPEPCNLFSATFKLLKSEFILPFLFILVVFFKWESSKPDYFNLFIHEFGPEGLYQCTMGP